MNLIQPLWSINHFWLVILIFAWKQSFDFNQRTANSNCPALFVTTLTMLRLVSVAELWFYIYMRLYDMIKLAVFEAINVSVRMSDDMIRNGKALGSFSDN